MSPLETFFSINLTILRSCALPFRFILHDSSLFSPPFIYLFLLSSTKPFFTTKSLSAGTSADTPGKFLDKNRTFHPQFDLAPALNLLGGVDTPTQTPTASKESSSFLLVGTEFCELFLVGDVFVVG